MTSSTQPHRSRNGSIFYITSMSNRFNVNDEQTFREWVANHGDIFDLPPITIKMEGIQWYALHGDRRWMSNPSFDAMIEHFAVNILHPGSIFMAMEIANDPVHGPSANACAYDSNGQNSQHSLAEIYHEVSGFRGIATSMMP